MADHRQLAILEDGPGVWNLWRRRNRAIVPDLSEAKLMDYMLRGGRFAKVNFFGTDLRRANASGGDLREANLREAIWQRA